MNLLNLFKNKIDRILNKKAVIVIALVIVPIMTVIGVLFSEKPTTKETIVFISDNSKKIPSNYRFQIEVIDKKPAYSNLLLGEYAAIVEEKEDGSYEVSTLKSETDKKVIEDFFKSGKIPDDYQNDDEKRNARGIGTNILGFILMIVLMQGVALTILFPEDRELKTFRRILTAPVNERQYLLVQAIFTFLFLYIPTYLAIILTKLCFRIELGFGIGLLAVLLSIITLFSTTFSLFITAVLEKNISLVASGICIVTCVLAGCFNSFVVNNKIIDIILRMIPQKAYMTLIQGMEKGAGILQYKEEIIYLFIWCVLFLFLGSIITRIKMKKGIY